MFMLPPLPYADDALAPTISALTMQTHHGKHHNAYVDTLNALLAEAGDSDASLEAVIRRSDGKLFNNAAQAWNHAFFWESMTPGGAKPEGELATAITDAFGDLAGLKEKFVAEGVGHFASGWVWLVVEAGALKVISTHDAATKVTQDGVKPILVCDVWEHAYYLDYKNVRKAFLEKWFDALANWDFAARQFAAALGQGDGYRYPSADGQA